MEEKPRRLISIVKLLEKENGDSMIRKIAVISDTHVPHFKKLPEAIWEHFDGIELIIHAGDLSVLAVLNELEAIAPVVAVQGNIEEDEVRMKLPVKREIVVGQCRIGIVHILGDAHNRVKVARQEFPILGAFRWDRIDYSCGGSLRSCGSE